TAGKTKRRQVRRKGRTAGKKTMQRRRQRFDRICLVKSKQNLLLFVGLYHIDVFNQLIRLLKRLLYNG
ncbi:hypothetical protein, partial [Bacillus haynesii]|uniref:hypothetical protein n=1 Tax=Bacillus haynesii TaxID=1925021 RepID=UPI002DDD01C7